MSEPTFPIPSWAAARATGLTPTDVAKQLEQLGDDNPTEHPHYNLSHALSGWAQATHNRDGDTAGQLRWTTETGTLSLSLTQQQADRLTQLLNIDTAIHLAHNAATRRT